MTWLQSITFNIEGREEREKLLLQLPQLQTSLENEIAQLEKELEEQQKELETYPTQEEVKQYQQEIEEFEKKNSEDYTQKIEEYNTIQTEIESLQKYLEITEKDELTTTVSFLNELLHPNPIKTKPKTNEDIKRMEQLEQLEYRREINVMHDIKTVLDNKLNEMNVNIIEKIIVFEEGSEDFNIKMMKEVNETMKKDKTILPKIMEKILQSAIKDGKKFYVFDDGDSKKVSIAFDIESFDDFMNIWKIY